MSLTHRYSKEMGSFFCLQDDKYMCNENSSDEPTPFQKSDENLDPEQGESSVMRPKKKGLGNGVRYAMYCDVGSRIAFPVVFAAFNIVYWAYYLRQLDIPGLET